MRTIAAGDDAFRHLLHDVASRVMGIGLTLDALCSSDDADSRSAEALDELRRGTDTLRHLLTDVGELARFVSRHGPAQVTLVPAPEIASELRKFGLPGMPPEVALICDDRLPAIAADKPLIGYVLAMLVRASWRHDGRVPTVRVRHAGGAVAFEVATNRLGNGSPLVDCWAYGKPPHAVDHFCRMIAEAHGGGFERTVDALERVACLLLPAPQV